MCPGDREMRSDSGSLPENPGGMACMRIMELLCVSCPSATEISAILFLLFVQSSSNSPRSYQRLRRTLRRNFNWIRQQIKNVPIDPIVKIGRFQQRYNVPESGQFLQWVSMGKFFTRRI